MRHVTYERVHYLRNITKVPKEEGSIFNELNAILDNEVGSKDM
jgi:hypothetical protein